MGIRRTLTGAVLGLAGSVLLALPASAVAPAPGDPYGPAPTPGALGVSATTVGPGGSVVVSGSGFAPNSTITITVTVNPQGFAGATADSGVAPLGRLLAAGPASATDEVRGFAALAVTANSAGSFSTTVTLTQAGTNVITASGVDPAGNPRSLTVVVEVAAGAGVGGTGDGSGSGSGSGSDNGASGVGGLPNTGASLKTPVLLGSVLILLGGGAAVLGRRRRRAADVAS